MSPCQAPKLDESSMPSGPVPQRASQHIIPSWRRRAMGIPANILFRNETLQPLPISLPRRVAQKHRPEKVPNDLVHLARCHLATSAGDPTGLYSYYYQHRGNLIHFFWLHRRGRSALPLSEGGRRRGSFGYCYWHRSLAVRRRLGLSRETRPLRI